MHIRGLHIRGHSSLEETGLAPNLLFIPDALIIELKPVDKLLPKYHAQTLTYMELAKINKALLINFNVARLVNGIKRFIF
jgi:GxxExxY protein